MTVMERIRSEGRIRTQRIAEAIVDREIELLYRAGDWSRPNLVEPMPYGLTVASILRKYGLAGAFGTYVLPSREVDVASQVVRNCLNRAFRGGRLAKLSVDGRLVREGAFVLFVDPMTRFVGHETVTA